MFSFSKKDKSPATPKRSAEDAVFGTAPQAGLPLTPEQKQIITQRICASFLATSYLALSGSRGMAPAKMQALLDQSKSTPLGETEGIRTMLLMQKMIIDGGDTAIAYQLKKWGCRDYPLEAKHHILVDGLEMALADGHADKADIENLEKLAKWLGMTSQEFAEFLKMLAELTTGRAR